MAERPARPAAPRRTPPRRHTFSVKEQLIGKLGPGGYGRLLDRLQRLAK